MRCLPGKSKISTGSFACKTAPKRSFRRLLILVNQDKYKNTIDGGQHYMNQKNNIKCTKIAMIGRRTLMYITCI
jgi:hypothetical protein